VTPTAPTSPTTPTTASGQTAGVPGDVSRPLPRGRHRLSRAEVERSQRSRLVAAMAEAVADKGYVATSVADVLRRAGVSRETYYQQFTSKLDCFMTAFETAGAALLDQLEAAAGTDGTPLERFDRALGAYLDALAAAPAFARVFLIEVHAAGPDALRRRAAFQQRIADRLADLLGLDTEQGRFTCEALVAAVAGLVTVPLIDGDGEALRRLRAPVVDLVRRTVTGG
jgi:AcrR family transcriptional regulator